MSLFIFALALPPATALAANGDAPSVEARRERHRQLREQVGDRLETLRTTELARALSLSEAEVAPLSEELRKFDERREPLREQLREARWTVMDAVRGDDAARSRVDAAMAAAAESRKRLADLDLEEYRKLAAMVPTEKHPELARFLVQFPQRVQRMIHGAGGCPGCGDGMGPGHRMGPHDGMGPGHGMGPRDGMDQGRGMGPRDGSGPGCPADCPAKDQ